MPHRWNNCASLRQRQIEGGQDITFSKVFVPYYAECLSRCQPKSVLEVGGGTGHLALSLSPSVEKYVMLEPASQMFGIADQVLRRTGVQIHSCTIESFATSERFEFILSHLCIQAVTNVAGFLKCLAGLLSDTGTFLLSLPHPFFYNEYKNFFPREEYSYIREKSAEVSFSVTLDPHNAISGVPYHHRPLSKYFSHIASAGLCVTHMDEIFPPPETQQLYGSAWRDPRYLVLGGCLAPSFRLPIISG